MHILAVINQHKKLDRIGRWANINSTVCKLCLKEEETGEHLFLKCEFGNNLWMILSNILQIQSHQKNSLNETLNVIFPNSNQEIHIQI